MPYNTLEKRREFGRKQNAKKRAELLEFMGGKCIKCGFSDSRALQIDHVNGGGRNKHEGSSRMFIKNVLNSLIKGEKKYQLLCANCNWIKRMDNKEYRKRD